MFSSSISSPHRAKRLNAAIVHAMRARKYAQTRWPTFLLWKTVVSIDSTVSTSMRVFQAPRGQTFMLAGSPILAWKPGIRQDNHLVIKLSNQRVKMRVVDVGGGAVPGTHQAPLVQDETEFATDNPPMIALPLLADLGGAAPFPHGMD